MKIFKKIKLDNGLRIILVPDEHSLATTVMVLVAAGSIYETKETNGLSHFLEHMCFKGTTKRPSNSMIASELDGLGAEYNAFTSHENTSYYAKARNKDFDKILDIVSDMYLNPLFDPEQIEKERGPIIEEINMREDLLHSRVQESFLGLVYGDTPAGWKIAGPKENILSLKRDDFLKYRGSHYVAEGTLVVVAGGFESKSVEEKIKKYFESIYTGAKSSRPKTSESQEKPQSRVDFKESDQTHLALGFRAFDLFDERRFALEVLTNVLGGNMSSRLFQKIRTEMSAAYYVSASADLYTDHGLFLASAGVDHKKIESVLKAILEECRALKEKEVPQDELRRSKDNINGHIFLSLESSDELAGFYGGQEILGVPMLTPKELSEKIEKVGAKEIQEVANAIFTNDRLNLAVIGPFKDKKFSDILRVNG